MTSFASVLFCPSFNRSFSRLFDSFHFSRTVSTVKLGALGQPVFLFFLFLDTGSIKNVKEHVHHIFSA
jgi:hypothetical protein